MTQNANDSVFLQLVSRFVFHSLSIPIVDIAILLVGGLISPQFILGLSVFAYGANVAQTIDMVIPIPSSSIFNVLGNISDSLNQLSLKEMISSNDPQSNCFAKNVVNDHLSM